MSLEIDDFRPQSVERPGSVAEASELVRRAAADGVGIYPVGGGTMLHYGQPPVKPGIAVDWRSLDQVVDYPARDMTITVGAGISIARLQQILAAENQRLPVDVPQPERATLGGAIAVNTSGPRRFGFGTLRDYVIGISFLTDQGTEAKAGGRVVKNVAGYDLCKLHIGALGTLGIVTQVTLKVKPIPEDHQSVAMSCPYRDLGEVLERIHQSQTRPTYVEVLGESSESVTVIVGFEENPDAVAWQVEQMIRELGSQAQPRSAEESAHVLNEIIEAMPGQDGGATIKASLLPSALAEFLPKLETPRWQASAGNGIVTAHFDGDLSKFDATLRRLRSDGSVVVMRCPVAWKRDLAIWGEPRSDWNLMKKIKQELDPQNIFNPGRFLV